MKNQVHCTTGLKLREQPAAGQRREEIYCTSDQSYVGIRSCSPRHHQVGSTSETNNNIISKQFKADMSDVVDVNNI